jgi:hypothetical protein
MNKSINKSEEFVHQVCRRSFLSVWSYANPQGKNSSKELCDILVVCDPHIIIISVKEIAPTESGNPKTDWDRWRRKAIEASVNQIYGAERFIETTTCVTKSDGQKGLVFPDLKARLIHRVSIAFGGQGKMPISFGDFGKGFVHVFDEISFGVLLENLDTIQDFVNYLSAKESLYKSGVETVIEGGEEDLLAIYLHNGRAFPKGDLLAITGNLWDQFKTKPEFIAQQREDEISYVWDRLIETVGADLLNGDIEFGQSLQESEICIRTMANEDRFSRRLLGKAFLEFMSLAAQSKVRSRCMPAPSGVVYVFLALPHGEDRKFRLAELGSRCFVARHKNPKAQIVVGLATERPGSGTGFSIDLVYFEKEIWTEEDQKKAEHIQSELGFFSNPEVKNYGEDEYPSS